MILSALIYTLKFNIFSIILPTNTQLYIIQCLNCHKKGIIVCPVTLSIVTEVIGSGAFREVMGSTRCPQQFEHLSHTVIGCITMYHNFPQYMHTIKSSGINIYRSRTYIVI